LFFNPCLWFLFLLILIKIIIKTRHEQRFKNKNATHRRSASCGQRLKTNKNATFASKEVAEQGQRNKKQNATFSSKKEPEEQRQE
jgi:hypothetical protein